MISFKCQVSYTCGMENCRHYVSNRWLAGQSVRKGLGWRGGCASQAARSYEAFTKDEFSMVTEREAQTLVFLQGKTGRTTRSGEADQQGNASQRSEVREQRIRDIKEARIKGLTVLKGIIFTQASEYAMEDRSEDRMQQTQELFHFFSCLKRVS